MDTSEKKILFPSEEWLAEYVKKINENPEYEKAAKDWEGDFLWVLEPDGTEPEEFRGQMITTYYDLWHGQCRKAFLVTPEIPEPKTEYIISGEYSIWVKMLKGELSAFKAIMMRKLKVKGNLAKIMRANKATMELNRSARMIENVEFLK
ncbi:MAG: SCP2 sterol-binding domain-containing protein [Promethearchaeota archaeon]